MNHGIPVLYFTIWSIVLWRHNEYLGPK